jgi:hypothetical protein
MTDRFLNMEIRLLLLRYGRRRILEALATVSEQPVEAVEAEIRRLEETKRVKSRKDKSSSELIEAASEDRPEIKSILSTLVTSYENRVFLPQLREVERFLNHAGVKHGKLKSRNAALPKVVQALTGFSVPDLQQLLKRSEAPEQSPYALLANELMGNRQGS